MSNPAQPPSWSKQNESSPKLSPPKYQGTTPLNPWSRFAIAGFILSLLHVFYIGVVLGLIFSIIGYRETKIKPLQGRGLSIAGIYIAIFWIFVGLPGSVWIPISIIGAPILIWRGIQNIRQRERPSKNKGILQFFLAIILLIIVLPLALASNGSQEENLVTQPAAKEPTTVTQAPSPSLPPLSAFNLDTPEGICDADSRVTSLQLNDLFAQKFGYSEVRRERTAEQNLVISVTKNEAFLAACPVRSNFTPEQLQQEKEELEWLQQRIQNANN